jgi:urea carboxylase
LQEGCIAVASPVSGSVWKIAVVSGQIVKAGDTLVTGRVDENGIAGDGAGGWHVVSQVRCAEGRAVHGRANSVWCVETVQSGFD